MYIVFIYSFLCFLNTCLCRRTLIIIDRFAFDRKLTRWTALIWSTYNFNSSFLYGGLGSFRRTLLKLPNPPCFQYLITKRNSSLFPGSRASEDSVRGILPRRADQTTRQEGLPWIQSHAVPMSCDVQGPVGNVSWSGIQDQGFGNGVCCFKSYSGVSGILTGILIPGILPRFIIMIVLLTDWSGELCQRPAMATNFKGHKGHYGAQVCAQTLLHFLFHQSHSLMGWYPTRSVNNLVQIFILTVLTMFKNKTINWFWFNHKL